MAQTGTPSPAQIANFPFSQDGTANDNTYLGSRDLLLKTFGGEVLTHYDENFFLKNNIRVRTIAGGKTAQFPAIGQAKAEHFIPGQVILGQDMATDEVTISIDDLIVSSVFINNLDEMLGHFQFRGEYAKQMGAAIAKTCELKLFQMAVRDALLGDEYRSTGTPGVQADIATNATGAGKGLVGMENAVVTTTNSTTKNAADLVTAAFKAAAYFDEHDMPTEGRFLYVEPSVYYSLINQTDKTIINSDFSAGNGNYGQAVIYKVAGFDIVKTNNLAVDGTANSNTGPDSRTPLNKPTGGLGQNYATDASDTLGLFMHTSGLGMAKVQDLTTESDYYVDRQGSLLVSKMLMGAATLRPDALYLVRAAADAS